MSTGRFKLSYVRHAKRYIPMRPSVLAALFASCAVLVFFSSCPYPPIQPGFGTITTSSSSNVRPKPPIVYNTLGVARSDQYPPHGAPLDSSREADLFFFIQLTEKSVPLAPRLIQRLWHHRNTILIHLDAKTPKHVVSAFMNAYNTPELSNVLFLLSATITYAGVSMLLNTLSAMEYALNSNRHWDYFINLSGSDYPTVSVQNMRILLGQSRILDQRVSFIHRKPNDFKLKEQRFDVQHIDTALGLRPGTTANTSLGVDFRTVDRKLNLDFPYLHSEAWLTAHRDMVLEAARGTFAKQLIALLANSKDPEEHFWPILTWNLPHLNNSVARHSGRGIFWELDGKLSGQHPYYVDQHIENGEYRFWNPIFWQHGCMFVRKFSLPNSPLMDLIDRRMSGVHPQASEIQSRQIFARIADAVLCFADIERQYYGDVLKCKS